MIILAFILGVFVGGAIATIFWSIDSYFQHQEIELWKETAKTYQNQVNFPEPKKQPADWWKDP